MPWFLINSRIRIPRAVGRVASATQFAQHSQVLRQAACGGNLRMGVALLVGLLDQRWQDNQLFINQGVSRPGF